MFNNSPPQLPGVPGISVFREPTLRLPHLPGFTLRGFFIVIFVIFRLCPEPLRSRRRFLHRQPFAIGFRGLACFGAPSSAVSSSEISSICVGASVSRLFLSAFFSIRASAALFQVFFFRSFASLTSWKRIDSRVASPVRLASGIAYLLSAGCLHSLFFQVLHFVTSFHH